MIEDLSVTFGHEPFSKKTADLLWHMSRYHDRDSSQSQRLTALEAVRKIYVDFEGVSPEVHQEMVYFLDCEVRAGDFAALALLRNPEPIID